ncbi:MAG: hypothetical protein IT584_00905 [Chlamydiae bacterium]|nr:hypothetical protein [Chlamydiota bacterium]
MASGINSSYNLLESLLPEELKQFISAEILPGDALVKQLTEWWTEVTGKGTTSFSSQQAVAF